MTRRRQVAAWVLFVAFVVVPLIEIFALIQVGRWIGAWPTILLLVADSIFGAWLVKREGRTAWRALNEALATGRMPARELADGALLLIGGTLMLAPGFVTDIVAFFLILPFTRPFARRILTRIIQRRMLVSSGPVGAFSRAGFGTPGGRTAQRPGRGQGPVVQGEVVDDD